MNVKEAADKIRPDFHLESMPPEDRHHVKFIEDVAAELGVESTPFNLHQVGQALYHADIHPDSNEYPKMLYSRTHHAEEGVGASVYEPRHDFVWAHVANDDEEKKLGSGWVESPADLPERGELPIYAEPKAPVEPQKDIDRDYDHQFGGPDAKIGTAPVVREPVMAPQNEPVKEGVI